MILGFVLRRLAMSAVLLVIVTILVFLLSHLSGDPARLMLGTDATLEQLNALRERMGLNKPLPLQYWDFLSRAVTGDLGTSLYYHSSASSLVMDRFPATLLLSSVAMLIALVVAIPAGFLSALKPNTFIDYFARTITALGQGVPAYWIGIMLILVVSVGLGWLPAGGYGSPAHLILPALTLGLWPMARICRVFRASVLDVLREDYVRTARAKGLSRFKIRGVHVTRNALIPVVNATALSFGTILGGAVVTEVVFTWPGIGRLALNAVYQRDFPVIQAVVLFSAFVFIVLNLLVDLIAAAVDPRIRLA